MTTMQERRAEVRMMCADLAEVFWRDRDGTTRHAVALLEDISQSGVCLQLEMPIPLGTAIRWEHPGQKFEGHVRYCAYREIGYFVGVQLQGDSKWSRKAFKPQHLLDPRKLVANAAK